jgi:hypothetical protein
MRLGVAAALLAWATWALTTGAAKAQVAAELENLALAIERGADNQPVIHLGRAQPASGGRVTLSRPMRISKECAPNVVPDRSFPEAAVTSLPSPSRVRQARPDIDVRQGWPVVNATLLSALLAYEKLPTDVAYHTCLRRTLEALASRAAWR